VTLQRPPPEIRTLVRNSEPRSKRETSFSGSARAHAIAAKNPAAPPPTIAICTRHRDADGQSCNAMKRRAPLHLARNPHPKENLDRRKSGKQSALMNSLNRFVDPVYCIMRLIVGLMFACHGAQLVLGMFGGMPGSDKPILVVGGWIQLVGGVLIALGLLTRVAAFIASGEMAVAYFMMHLASAPTVEAKLFPILNHGELAAFYCWVFLFIFFYGPGRLSVDAMRRRGSDATTSTP